LKKGYALWVALLAFLHTVTAQQAVDLATITDFLPFHKQMVYQAVPAGSLPHSPNIILEQPFYATRDSMITRHNFSAGYCFKFTLVNRGLLADSVLFYPGLVMEAQLFGILDSTDVSRVTSIYIHNTEVTGQQIKLPVIRLQPGEQRSYLVMPRFRYFNYRDWLPTLVRHHSVTNMMYTYRVRPELNFLFTTLFFLGILSTMCVYAFIRFFTTRLREFLFYGLSALCFIGYFFYQVTLLFNFSEGYNSLDLFLKQFLQIGAHIFYMLFATYFLNLPKHLPFLYRLMQWIFLLLLAYLTVVMFTAFNDRYYALNMTMFNVVRILLLLYSLYAIPLLFRCKIPLAKYVATGATAVSVFAGLAFYYSSVPIGFTGAFFIAVGGPIAFFKLGILTEQVCFILGLNRKLQMEDASHIKAVEILRIENEKKEFEKFMAVLETREKERTRIAQEIHDDIGSGLTTIRLLSEIAKTKTGNGSLKEIDKISASANELIENMNEIIWSFNSKNDTLPNLVAYIRRYVVTFFEPTSIQVKISIPPQIPAMQISGDFRRSVFLVVKESIHNILKHAQATTLELRVETQPRFSIVLKDNGRGFAAEDVKLFSNGLRSMKDRMESIGGSFSISGHEGTTVELSVSV
jgi:signal transduction histidine kinase